MRGGLWGRSVAEASGAHLMLGQLRQRAAHVLLQPVQGHGRLIGQDVDTLSELVCDWLEQIQSWGPGSGVAEQGKGSRDTKIQSIRLLTA